MGKNKVQTLSLILGSKSPRRKELLSYLGIPFEIIPSHFDERKEEMQAKDPLELCSKLSFLKGQSVLEICKKREGHQQTFFPIILSSDTLVSLNNKIYSTPKNKEEAESFLRELSGKTHDVYTAFSLLDFKGRCETHVSQARVSFDKISEETLKLYLKTSDSLDKAGAYGIQGPALSFVSRVEGSYSSVMGLPVSLVLEKLNLFVRALYSSKVFQGDFRGLFHE